MSTKEKIIDILTKRGKTSGKDLSGFLGITGRATRKQLANLLKDCRIAKVGKPPKVYYFVPQRPYDDLKKITQTIVKKYKPEKIILFGSYARGEQTENSDLDFFVVKNTDKKYFERILDAKKNINYDKSIDLIVYTPKEFEEAKSKNTIFIRQVLNFGKNLYENGKYLQ